MADKRVSDLPAVTSHTANDVLLLDGATSRSIKVRDALGWKEPEIITGATGTVTAGVSSAAVQRAAPSATNIQLPSVADQDGQPLHIFDWSTSVTDHEITLTPSGTETIMLAASWAVYSNAAQLGSITLYPSTNLQGWYIAP